MSLAKKCVMIFIIYLLFPIYLAGANTNQYGSVYDDSIPVKPIGYLFGNEDINGEKLSIQGTIISQCKGDGCWFILKDKTGEVLVDLKPYDIRTPLGIEGSKVKLNGRVSTENEKVRVDAISIVILE